MKGGGKGGEGRPKGRTKGRTKGRIEGRNRGSPGSRGTHLGKEESLNDERDASRAPRCPRALRGYPLPAHADREGCWPGTADLANRRNGFSPLSQSQGLLLLESAAQCTAQPLLNCCSGLLALLPTPHGQAMNPHAAVKDGWLGRDQLRAQRRDRHVRSA